MDFASLIEKADQLAAKAHQGQVDATGAPYIEHPRKVASFLDDPQLKVVALLHDVMEDTDVKESQIRKEFGDEITDLLLLLTHRADQTYREYIRTISTNPKATKVKLADLKHNMDLTRFTFISQKSVDFCVNRYIPAYNFLMNGGEY